MTFTARRVIQALLVLFSLLLFYRLGSWGVLETSEARYAEMSREMYLSGDYLHPTFTGLRHYHKPPMTYAITALAYRLFGVSPWSARFFLQIALLAQLWLMYRIGVLLLDRQAALWAVAIYASFPAVLIGAHNLTTDLYLTTFLLAGVWAFLRSQSQRHPLLWLLLTYTFCGLAALTKGAGVVILPAVLLPTYYLLHPPASWWKTIARHALNVLVFLVVGLSWYAALIVEDPFLLHYFVVEQTVHRYTSDQWMRAKPAYFYLVTVLATTLPWGVALIAHGRWWLAVRALRKTMLWLAAWVVGPILFYSFAQSKLILYVLPAYAGIGLLTAVWLQQDDTSGRQIERWLLIMQIQATILLVALLATPWLTTQVAGGVRYYAYLGFALPLIWYLPRHTVATTANGAERLLIVSLLFATCLIPIGREFLAHNELLVNSPQPLVRYLKERGLGDREVHMLNRELPGLAFGLETDMKRLYEGGMPRDTSRQVNELWHERWYDVSVPATVDLLSRRWHRTPIVVIAPGAPSDSLRNWLEGLGQQDRLGRYYIYYN
ncbi:ArnT family glycosyltransferase [Neolewinella sp.]|uniref:ArnT family glycosyltransferase n=1 Tax=Neolewinella sp. TaxID=2993543 RepID=UPI003B51E858